MTKTKPTGTPSATTLPGAPYQGIWHGAARTDLGGGLYVPLGNGRMYVITEGAGMTNYYRVTVAGSAILHTGSVRHAYQHAGRLLATGLLARGTEVRITFVSASGVSHPVSLNWAR